MDMYHEYIHVYMHGYAWTFIDVHGYAWICMAVHGYSWIYSDESETGVPWVTFEPKSLNRVLVVLSVMLMMVLSMNMLFCSCIY